DVEERDFAEVLDLDHPSYAPDHDLRSSLHGEAGDRVDVVGPIGLAIMHAGLKLDLLRLVVDLDDELAHDVEPEQAGRALGRARVADRHHERGDLEFADAEAG